jgi:hypothetical protein
MNDDFEVQATICEGIVKYQKENIIKVEEHA